MLRLCYVVIISLPCIIYYVGKAHFIERYLGYFSEERRYRMVRRCIRIIMHHGHIVTTSTGQENLPKEGGYVLYPNHQGKYDTLGIMYAHVKPCTIVMDYYRSRLPIVNPFMDLLKGKRLDKANMKNQINTIFQIIEEVKEGRRYIVFPEGGYDHNRNELQKFMPGAFQCATKAKAPIVPVALIDSYKPFNMNSLKKVRTQVHFLKPIYYEEYCGMTTAQIADMVKASISEAIEKSLEARK